MTSVRLFESGRGIQWRRLIDLTGADTGSIPRLRRRDRITVILVENIASPAASILKQCMLSGGADALVHREVLTCRTDFTNAAVYGTPSSICRGCDSMKGQPFGLEALSLQIRRFAEHDTLPDSIEVNGIHLSYKSRPLIMGILNVTPDSFSDGGRYHSPADAVKKALQMEGEGASMIDIGGESTRPGSSPVSAEEQISRVIPVIRGIRAESGVPVSIDTSIPDVARAALSAGAGLINSINGMETPGMAEIAAETGVPVCVMHMQGTPKTMQQRPEYRDASGEIADYLLSRVEYLEEHGICRERILVDPGIGFGKNLENNLDILRSLEWIGAHTRCRVLLGHSRKSFYGMLCGVEDPSERDALTHVTSVILSGADILRVHDVRGTVAAFKIADALGVFE